jgi:hypothetical protein
MPGSVASGTPYTKAIVRLNHYTIQTIKGSLYNVTVQRGNVAAHFKLYGSLLYSYTLLFFNLVMDLFIAAARS